MYIVTLLEEVSRPGHVFGTKLTKLCFFVSRNKIHWFRAKALTLGLRVG